jgi:hypothetical protein
VPVAIGTLQELKTLKDDWLQPVPSGATSDTPLLKACLDGVAELCIVR